MVTTRSAFASCALAAAATTSSRGVWARMPVAKPASLGPRMLRSSAVREAAAARLLLASTKARLAPSRSISLGRASCHGSPKATVSMGG
jgi:hypothetical protein